MGRVGRVSRFFPPAVMMCLLAGCGAEGQVSGALLGLNVAAIPVIHRDLIDAVYSASTGRDCSIVRLDEGQPYCKPPEAPPAPPRYCTRSLGAVDCWAERYPHYPEGVANGPLALTPAQEADRARPWPPL